jgi:hypothetical protein
MSGPNRSVNGIIPVVFIGLAALVSGWIGYSHSHHHGFVTVMSALGGATVTTFVILIGRIVVMKFHRS